MPDFRSFRASAVVLRHADWGEADQMLTLYTREQGMVRAVAKGARKMTSRKAGHLQPFTGRFSLYCYFLLWAYLALKTSLFY